jgi:hypothetical protein
MKRQQNETERIPNPAPQGTWRITCADGTKLECRNEGRIPAVVTASGHRYPLDISVVEYVESV